MSLADPDHDLRQIIQEEVGEVLARQHHDGLHARRCGTVSNVLQCAEEPFRLSGGADSRSAAIIGACEEE